MRIDDDALAPMAFFIRPVAKVGRHDAENANISGKRPLEVHSHSIFIGTASSQHLLSTLLNQIKQENDEAKHNKVITFVGSNRQSKAIDDNNTTCACHYRTLYST